MANLYFLRGDGYRGTIPELAFALLNYTSGPWTKLRFRIEVDYTCEGVTKTIKREPELALGFSPDQHLRIEFKERVPLSRSAEGCVTDDIRVTFLTAETMDLRIDEVTGVHTDLAKQRADEDKRLAVEQERRNMIWEQERAEAAKKAEAEEKADKDKAEREFKAQQEELARYRKQQQEKQRKAKAACIEIYKSTSEKRLSDLTVREAQAVSACQSLGLYSAR